MAVSKDIETYAVNNVNGADAFYELYFTGVKNAIQQIHRSCWILRAGYTNINDKNCSLSTVLTAMDQKLQKS